VAVIDALTKLLPDSVWLTDLRLENGVLDITGLAKSGAALLPLFEHSPLFADAAMASGVNFDPQENKERFSLRVRVRQAGVEAAARDSQEKRWCKTWHGRSDSLPPSCCCSSWQRSSGSSASCRSARTSSSCARRSRARAARSGALPPSQHYRTD